MNNRLKELRKTLGLRQRQIAERLGVSVGNVGNWEIGREPIPRARLYQLCKEYNVNEDWLVNGRGEMFAPPPSPVNEREAQRQFILNCFRSLPVEIKDVLLDALGEFVDETRASKTACAPTQIIEAKNNN